MTAAEFTASLASWDKAAAQMAAFHKTFDMYVTPAAAFQAPKIGELTHTQKEAEELMKVSGMEKDEQQALVYDMFLKSLTYTPFTQLANLTGQPAMSVPVHLTKTGFRSASSLQRQRARSIGCFEWPIAWSSLTCGLA